MLCRTLLRILFFVYMFHLLHSHAGIKLVGVCLAEVSKAGSVTLELPWQPDMQLFKDGSNIKDAEHSSSLF